MTSDFSAAIDLSKYDCFRVKESLGQTKYEFFSILRSDNCDLKLLRTKLWEKFGIPIDRCISYFDEDDDQVPINLECEFDAALQLTRKATTVDTTILLIVGNFSANNLYWKMSPNEHKFQTEICKELNASMLRYWHSSSPPLWFTTYMESMKKDMVATITSQVLNDVTEILNKRLLDMLVLSKEHSSSKIFNEKNQKKPKFQDDESNNVYVSVKPVNESVNMNTEDDSQMREISTLSWEIFRKTYKTQNTARLIAEDMRTLHQLQMELYTKLELYRCFENAVDEHHQLLSQITTDNLDSNSNKTGQVNLPPVSISEKGFSNTMNMLKTENELRMSCSITGHQMLDENRSSNDISRCNKNLSDEEKEKEDESFEIIQMPDSENSGELFVPREESQHNSRDSPSFELVSETSSTRVSPPCSIYMNEDHFSTFEEEHLCTPVCKLRHLMDFHDHLLGRRFDPHCYYSMTALKLYSTMTCPSKLLNVKQSEERKNSQSSKCPINKCMNYGAHDDMKDSHTSYLSVPSYCGSETQSQCSVQSYPSNDVTQSFHSHTTSIADTTHVEPWNMFRYRHAQNKMEHSIVNKGVRTATKDNRDIPSCGMCWRCLLTVVAPYTCGNKECVDCNYNLPEILEKYFSDNIIPCTSHNNTTQSESDQPNESSEKSKPPFINELNELGTVDPVHILPETLVTAAAQVGCFAYDTAREMFDKLRAHTKEEPVKHRDEIKCDNKKLRIKMDSKNG